MNIFFLIFFNISSAQKNRLIETVLLCTLAKYVFLLRNTKNNI